MHFSLLYSPKQISCEQVTNSMKEFWDDRYKQEEYIYGKTPNNFFKNEIDKLKAGQLLLPAEGEGRNAVYAAKKGWKVSAFDISEKGKEKAIRLANKNNVVINYTVESILEITYPDEQFDCAGILFVHLPPEIRRDAYIKLIKKVKKGGSVIIEVFSKKQINYNSGGPGNIDMLFDISELEEIFGTLSEIKFEEKEVDLDEGPYHQGKAVTIRGVGIK